jgi:uncharacterized membrane protein YccC
LQNCTHVILDLFNANAKARKKRTDDDLPVHSFLTLLADLSTIAKNQIAPDPQRESRVLQSPINGRMIHGIF